MAEAKDGDTFLCLACGNLYEGKPEESGEHPAVAPCCPACRSGHVLNLTQGNGSGKGCGADSDDFSWGWG